MILAVGLPTLLILLIMLGLVAGVSVRDGFPFFDLNLHWPSLLTANTPTGGDMGAQIVLPQYLRDTLLPSGRILGWSNQWYAGYPVFYFYFPLPALFTVLLDLFLPYGVAFKLTTIVGLVALPFACYYLIRRIGFARPVAAIAATIASMFVFMESFSIFGANIKSTLAGEFAFSWSFALSLIYLGIVIGDTREGRGFTPKAGIVLALTALSHVVTTIVVVIVSLPLFLRRKGASTLLPSWLLGLALAGFWAVPVAVRTLGGMSTDMGWTPLEGIRGSGISNVGTPLPGELIPFFALGVVGLIWSVLRREDVGVLATMTILPFLGYLLIAERGWTILYNARLLPYWFIGVYLFAGIAVGLGLTRLARWLPNRNENILVGGLLVIAIVMTGTMIGIRDVPGWVNWNFQGYEGKAQYPELKGIMETIDRLPPGRVMWEYNKDEGVYGTPMALMLFPYWSEDHPSMEGLFFESSLTTPFHFLNQAELSRSPSQPVRGLRYHPFDLERGVKHMALFNVRYYVTFTEETAREAERIGLRKLADSPPFEVFALPESSPVDVAAFTPMVYAGDEDFVDVALNWYDDVDMLRHWIVADGPPAWPRFYDATGPFNMGAPLDTANAVVSDVKIENQRISFRTTAIGVPHLIKVSYFPNWKATGADGPYRAAPSLMIVVPTQEQVTLEFSRTWAEDLGRILTLVGIAFLVGWAVYRRRRRVASEV